MKLRTIPLKLPSACLQVTCTPASCSLASQNPSQPHDNRSLINKHLTFTLRYEPQKGRITTRCKYSSLAIASARQYSTCYERKGTVVSSSINAEGGSGALVLTRNQKAIARPSVNSFQVRIFLTFAVQPRA